MVNHPNRSKRRTWRSEAAKRLQTVRGIDIPVGSDLHLLEMALAERTKLADALNWTLGVLKRDSLDETGQHKWDDAMAVLLGEA